MCALYLVAGLGNIGKEYEFTRHNMGFIALDEWARSSNAVFSPDRYGSIAELKEKNNRFLLLKPSTYMNESGKAVRYWMNRCGIPLERIIVLCDDLNLPFGSLRLRRGGSDGGHNGLKNIAELLGTQDYARLRMGIGNDYAKGRQIDFVLGQMSPEQLEQCGLVAGKAIEGVKMFAECGVDRAMNSVNAKEQNLQFQKN